MNMPAKKVANTLKRFEYDRWVSIDPEELQTGDLFCFADQIGVATGPAHKEGDSLVLRAEPFEPGPIRIAIGMDNYLCMVMDYTGCGIHEFGDGTGIIAELDTSTSVYSPRLPMDELAAFCKEHIARYEQFFDENEETLNRHEFVPMEPFWSQEEVSS